MRRTIIRTAFAAAVLAAGCVPSLGAGAITLKEVHVCELVVAELIQHANVSFSVTYELTLDGAGKLESCRQATDKDWGISKEATVACLSRWRFSGQTENAIVKVTFRWDHYFGWTDISIVGESLEHKLVLPRRYR